MLLLENMPELQDQLSTRDLQFLIRIYNNGLEKYKSHIIRLGLEHSTKVLDAGSGFGQWSFAFAELNSTNSVTAIDISGERISVSNTLCSLYPELQVHFEVASLESIPYPDNHFDCAFSFSSIYYVDVEKALRELTRVVCPGGKIYICTNAIGWYVYNLVCAPNATPDFRPRLYGLRTIGESILSKMSGRIYLPRTSTVTSKSYLRHLLRRQGIPASHIQLGLEGTLSQDSNTVSPSPLLRQKYMCLDSCIECLFTKP